MESEPVTPCGIRTGDRVCHKREITLTGTIRHVDTGYEVFGDVTTCEVEWDDDPGSRDVQWTNKLEVLE